MSREDNVWINVVLDGAQLPQRPVFCLPQQNREPSVEVLGPDCWRLAEQTRGLRFTGIASKWTCELHCVSSGVELLLHWSTPDRSDDSKVKYLMYRDFAPSYDKRLEDAVDWIHGALGYVFQHEADETLVLGDGTCPFDPHASQPRR